MKKILFLVVCTAYTLVLLGQDRPNVSINIPTGATPKSAFDVYGTAWIDTLPSCTSPQYLVVLEHHDSTLKKIRIDSLAMLLQSYTVTQTPIIRTYTSSGTWTKPLGLKYIIVEVVGGGGGGAGSGNSKGNSGSGGGAGGYTRKIIPNSLLLTTESVTVGVGGNGGDINGNTGFDGTTSLFGIHCFATGGKGGISVFFSNGQGGQGGLGNGGDVNIIGGGGGGGSSLGNTGIGTTGGTGGESFFGGTTAGSGLDANGILSQQYGSGGGGGSYINGVRKIGGNGGNGIVIITEYY